MSLAPIDGAVPSRGTGPAPVRPDGFASDLQLCNACHDHLPAGPVALLIDARDLGLSQGAPADIAAFRADRLAPTDPGGVSACRQIVVAEPVEAVGGTRPMTAIGVGHRFRKYDVRSMAHRL